MLNVSPGSQPRASGHGRYARLGEEAVGARGCHGLQQFPPFRGEHRPQPPARGRVGTQHPARIPIKPSLVTGRRSTAWLSRAAERRQKRSAFSGGLANPILPRALPAFGSLPGWSGSCWRRAQPNAFAPLLPQYLAERKAWVAGEVVTIHRNKPCKDLQGPDCLKIAQGSGQSPRE